MRNNYACKQVTKFRHSADRKFYLVDKYNINSWHSDCTCRFGSLGISHRFSTMKSSPISRRAFLKSGTSAAVVSSVGVGLTSTSAYAAAQSTGTTLDYPANDIGLATDMPVNEPVSFSYPDARSPCMAIKMGTAVPGGVGPEQDIVAYSILCTHMGCPVAYDGDDRVFKCNCHYSMFDAEKSGQMVSGQATEDLPRVLLEYNSDNDTVTAVGIDGLIYGRQANIL